MSNSIKVIAALGVAAGVGVAALPVSTFAVAAQSEDVTITATVATTHTIAVDANTKTVTGLAAGATDDSMTSTITIKSNNANGYSVSVAAAGDSGHETALYKDATNQIPAFSAEQTTLSNTTPGWGGKLGGAYTGASGLTNTGWNGFTTGGSQLVTSITAPTPAPTDPGDTYTVNYGIALDQAQASGNYTGKVTYTLSATE